MIEAKLKEAIMNSHLGDLFKSKLIEKNGKAWDTIFIGKYKEFYIFESESEDSPSFALNSDFSKLNGFDINSYDGISDVKQYINEL